MLTFEIALICLTLAPISAGDQPTNDSCQLATPINGEGVFEFDNTLATNDGPETLNCSEQLPNDATSIANDVWFCWTAACSGTVTVDTCAYTTVDTKVAVYDGCGCPAVATNLLACDNDSCGFQSRVSFEAKEGLPYLIQIGTSTSLGGGKGKFRITCGALLEPPCDAAELNCIERDHWNALRSHSALTFTAEDFTPLVDGVVTELCWWGTYFDGEGDCQSPGADYIEVTYHQDVSGLPGPVHAGPFREWVGSLNVEGPARTFQTIMGDLPEYEYHASHAPVPVQANQCYWVRVNFRLFGDCLWYWATARTGNGRAIVDDGGNSNPNGFDLGDLVTVDPAVCLNIEADDLESCAVAPSNDNCTSALAITDGEIDFDTSVAQTDGGPHIECLFPVGDEQIHRDIWYTYVATCTGTLRVETCESQFDTKIALYSGSRCPIPESLLTCNDDQCGADLSRQSMVDWPVKTGLHFLIRVGGYNESGGPGRLFISCTEPPTNDLCEESIVQGLPFTLTGDNTDATNSCPQFAGGDVWAAFVVPEMASVTVEFTGENDVTMDAWSALATDCTCQSFIAAELVDAIDNGVRLTWNCLPPAVYYYPAVVDPTNEGNYTISASGEPCVLPCTNSAADCCSPHGGTGCGDSACCELICQNDAYCCLFEWDELCAQRASAACLSCPTSPCLTATIGCLNDHSEPGCFDPDICQAVCACQFQCCTDGWDETCLDSGQAEGCSARDYFDTPQSFPCGQFNFDCSPRVDLTDYRVFAHCFDGPCIPPGCGGNLDNDDICRSGDNFDGEITLEDFRGFLAVFNPQ